MIKSNYTGNKNNVIVVGSNSGLGQDLIKKLIEIDCTTFGIDIQSESLTDESNQFVYHQSNPVNFEGLSKTAEIIKSENVKIHHLVNLTGTITNFDTIQELSKDEWDDTFDICFKSCLNACKIYAPYLEAGGTITNMSSGLAFIGQKKYGPYSAAKASIISLTKTLAVELGPEINVNAIAPGAIDTPFIRNESGETRFNVDSYNSMTIKNRMATPQDITSLILFLMSDAAAYITGQCIHVNGGSLML